MREWDGNICVEPSFEFQMSRKYLSDTQNLILKNDNKIVIIFALLLLLGAKFNLTNKNFFIVNSRNQINSKQIKIPRKKIPLFIIVYKLCLFTHPPPLECTSHMQQNHRNTDKLQKLVFQNVNKKITSNPLARKETSEL